MWVDTTSLKYLLQSARFKKKCNERHVPYPLFSFKDTNDRLSKYIVDLKDDQKFKFIYGLKVTSSEIEFIKLSTQEEINDPAWFKHSKHRFTASVCIKIGDTSPKTLEKLKNLSSKYCPWK